ncbi:MAG: glycoside hydrolase family 2 TIM barrel-domain containing protein [Rikenellaceae bacterium]
MTNLTKFLTALFLLLFISTSAFSQRVKQTINDGWQFSKFQGDASQANFDASEWEILSIPHTWNNIDTDDETNGYFRAKGWYRRNIKVESLVENQRVYLYFEGANQETDVYINGEFAGNHKGGYSAFTFDITDFVTEGENLMAICVDNKHDVNIPPLSADFTFYGGIYRDLYLVYTPETSISLTHHASCGVYLTPFDIQATTAQLRAKTYLSNSSDELKKLTLETEIIDNSGKTVATAKEKVKLKANTENIAYESTLKLKDVTRWDIDNPYLYTVYSRLYDASGKEIDCIVNNIGVREFSFDPNTGFTLNGTYRKLMGTNRHQDYHHKGNALRDEMHVRDIELIKGMGSNFLRVAHYPQDPTVMQKCDQLGLLTSVEVPIVDLITLSDEFKQNCLDQTLEMVYQGYNSPSLVIWAYMNEVLLRPPYDSKDKVARQTYLDAVYDIASEIENIIREIDPTRYTMLPVHYGYELYKESGIMDLPMVIGLNLYSGWYGGELTQFEEALEKTHREFPEQSIFLTEYGADLDPRLHTFNPLRFDFTCEYGNVFHEHYVPEILKRDFIVGSTVWNYNDFFSEGRRDAVPHVNNKGLVGTDRVRKDLYFYYQALLKSEPVVHIVTKPWTTRAGASADGKTATQPLKIYTNAESVEVIHNGKSVGTYAVKDKIANLSIDFTDGENVIEAVIEGDGRVHRDQYRCNFKCINVKNNFSEMSVMLGSQRYFEDETAELCWIPEQAYTPGSWGYVGGEMGVTKTGNGLLPSSEIQVFGTDHEPIFQTQRVGIEAFKADVPDGSYAVYLYLSELLTDKKREALAYNLGNTAIDTKLIDRSFSIDINGTRVENNLNLAKEYGSERAVIKKYVVTVSRGEGLTVSFGEIESQPILNAIRIVKEH